MARRTFAKGSRAWGMCARTGDRVLAHDLVRDGETKLLVTREAYEPYHPQKRVVEVYDPQALRRPAPDLDNPEDWAVDEMVFEAGVYEFGVYD